MKKTRIIFVALSIAAFSSVHAYINPDYTPVNLFRAADTVLVLSELKIEEEDGDPVLRGRVAGAVKGKGEWRGVGFRGFFRRQCGFVGG